MKNYWNYKDSKAVNDKYLKFRFIERRDRMPEHLFFSEEEYIDWLDGQDDDNKWDVPVILVFLDELTFQDSKPSKVIFRNGFRDYLKWIKA